MPNEYIYSQIFSIPNTKPYAYDTYLIHPIIKYSSTSIRNVSD